MKSLLLFAFAILACLSSAAQKFALRGQVTDTLASAMPSATVMLLNQTDSSLVNFGVSDKSGVFEIKNVSRGNFLLKVTFV